MTGQIGLQRGLVFIASSLCLLTLAACDGKPCSEPPKYDEYDEEVREQIDDMLDDGDVYENQKERIFELDASLDPLREKMRAKREVVRTKMIDALVATEPKPDQFHALIDQMYGVIMPYAYASVDLMLKAHRMLTAEQRAGVTESWEEPPDPYTGSWAINRGIDAALLKIDATDEQKTLVLGWRDKMVTATDKLFKDQHAIRMRLIAQWKSSDPDSNVVRKDVDEAAGQISKFVHMFGGAAMEVTQSLTPAQRMWTNQQVNKLRRCPE